jgi:anti-anti-sigma factor
MNKESRRARHLASVSQEKLGERAIVVALKGTFDLSNAEGLGNSITAALDGSSGPVVIDLAQVSWLDSAAIGVLVTVGRRGLALRRTVALIRPPDVIWEGLEALSLGSLFVVFETRDEAARDPAIGP